MHSKSVAVFSRLTFERRDESNGTSSKDQKTGLIGRDLTISLLHRNGNMFNSGEVAWESVFRMSRVKKHCLLFFSFSISRDAKKKVRYEKKESVSSMCAFLFRNIKAYGVETFSFVGKVKYFIS